MPKITEVGEKERKGLSIFNLPWLEKAIGPELLDGGIYLLAGEPGWSTRVYSEAILKNSYIRFFAAVLLLVNIDFYEIKLIFKRGKMDEIQTRKRRWTFY